MRSFFGKIFLCMVLVPVVARGGGLLLVTTLGDEHPPGERSLLADMPAIAALTAAELARNGPDSVRAMLKDTNAELRLVADCHATGGRPHMVPVAQTGFCIAALPPPHPLVLGLVPASWWLLLPLLELTCCGFVSFFLARYLAGPIRRTRAAALAFAAGDLTARPSLSDRGSRQDEAADLEREFDRMADVISAMIEAQRRFIGDVSHEIRSPLGRLTMALGLARREAPESLAPRFDRMEREVDSVSRMVRELLALASLHGSVAPPKTELVELSALLDHVVEDMTFEFSERAQGIRVVRRRPPVFIRGDAALLRRAVENVLRNALFYTPEHTAVEVIVDHDGPSARLLIRDHGPGVPEAALPQLFDPFFRVDEARARNTGGTGLGLTIARRAVVLHGGTIEASNARPSGLTVRIMLPAADGLSQTAREALHVLG